MQIHQQSFQIDIEVCEECILTQFMVKPKNVPKTQDSFTFKEEIRDNLNESESDKTSNIDKDKTSTIIHQDPPKPKLIVDFKTDASTANLINFVNTTDIHILNVAPVYLQYQNLSQMSLNNTIKPLTHSLEVTEQFNDTGFFSSINLPADCIQLAQNYLVDEISCLNIEEVNNNLYHKQHIEADWMHLSQLITKNALSSKYYFIVNMTFCDSGMT
ncbi:Hypothetical_protein [Hexamita inflata]|uniref:Hypothetical_protein n=1 Tax=Hexamita inflata TaxID=28002 RepID=A0AA86TRU4_9EUKA|nr:Hypothetical protein HINF_LOCUS13846 [Hexamita inflata]